MSKRLRSFRSTLPVSGLVLVIVPERLVACGRRLCINVETGKAATAAETGGAGMETKTMNKQIMSKREYAKVQGTRPHIGIIACSLLFLSLGSPMSGANARHRKLPHLHKSSSQRAHLQAVLQKKIARLEAENTSLHQQLADAHDVEHDIRRALRAYSDQFQKQTSKIVALEAQQKKLQQTNDEIAAENKRLLGQGK